jgi:hypothetical protein
MRELVEGNARLHAEIVELRQRIAACEQQRAAIS